VAPIRSGLGRYFVIVTGLVLTLGGVAAAALFLTSAGEGLVAQAVIMGAATIAGLGGGMALLVASARRRGGMLTAEPTGVERATYWARYRSRWRGRHV
jgi:predicted membrane-bound spermidine synthase